MKAHYCSCCHKVVHDHEAVRPASAAAALCMAGLAAGGATKNAWAIVGLAVLGAIIGHAIDQEITPKCPICGELLEALAAAAFRL